MCGNSKAVTHTHTHTGLAALTWCYLRIQLPSPGPACGWDADADVWGKNRSKKKKKKRRSGRGHTTLFLRRPGRPSVKLPFSFIPDCLFLQNEFSKTDFVKSFPVLVSSLRHLIPLAPPPLELLKLKRSPCWMWGRCRWCAEKKTVVNQLQDTCWTNTKERQPIKSN